MCKLVVTNEAGEEIYCVEVSLKVPRTIGWNLSMGLGEQGLIREIKAALYLDEKLALLDKSPQTML